MNFTTARFLFLFLPFFLVLYFFAQPRWRPVIGILASLLFYAWGSVANLVLIVCLILFNYRLAILLEAKPARWTLVTGIVINAGLLIFFKLFLSYGFDLFFGLSNYFPERLTIWMGSLTFPLGLSYLSFQCISYLVDVQRATIKPARNIVAFAFYVLMFPKLLAGPIVPYRVMADQLSEPTLDRSGIAEGIRRFLMGFAKKMLIADVLANLVNAVFSQPADGVTPGIGWLALVGFALQIYYDFSGYSDMAIGLAGIMGLRFVENFNHPYMARNIGDFWRRWHISLSTWFREYVFFPLERRRLPFFGQSINILLVFLLTGLWHGVTVNFILWGLIHGFFLVLEGLFLGRWLEKTNPIVRSAYTLAVLLFSWLFFRAPDPAYALDYIRILFVGNPNPIQLTFNATSPLPFIEPTFLLAFIAGVVFAFPIGPALQSRLFKSIPLTAFHDVVLILLFILSVGMMASGNFLPGIYEGF